MDIITTPLLPRHVMSCGPSIRASRYTSRKRASAACSFQAGAASFRFLRLCGSLRSESALICVYPRPMPLCRRTERSQQTICLVRMRGLEPPLPCENMDLNHARLPIPPHPHAGGHSYSTEFAKPILRAVFRSRRISAITLRSISSRTSMYISSLSPIGSRTFHSSVAAPSTAISF